ncbi:ferrous iron transport protein B, partial [uncultured Parasutterella sp.]|uniref:ferrous iron transport protein B n=1 Tax=uncultured Parasutterella sp. TaxID=1263098 RepID=UPI00272D7FAD
MTHKNIVAIIGNPNCGKTTLFNVLTGAKQSVGNWPGVTVEKKTGGFNIDKREITLVDLPGIYSLQPSSSVSEDERVARDYVASSEAQAIINIVDASNLERNLYLTAQLLELQIPMVVVVNMLDVAKTHGLEINLEKLQDELGCPVVGIVASRKKGIEELKQALDKQLSEPEAAANPIVFSADIENAITKVGAILAKQAIPRSRWVAEQLVEGDAEILKVFPGISIDEAEPILQEIDTKYDGDVDMAMADVRYQFVSKVSQQSIVRTGQAGQTLTDKIDKVVLNRWLGIPIFLGVMYLMFIFAINIGSAFIDFFDILFGAIFIDGFGELLTYLGTPEWLKTILADGIGGGIQCVSTFVPVIACMFFALSFLEDSG